MRKFLALKECLFLCTSWLFRRIIFFPLTNSSALRLSPRRVKERSIFIWLLAFIPLLCPNFSQTRFLLNYTLLILRFWDKICLTLSASWQPIILDKSENLTGNSSSCHFVITHVCIISCQAPNFQHQGRTAEENVFTQRTSLLPSPPFTDMTIRWWYSEGSSWMKDNAVKFWTTILNHS